MKSILLSAVLLLAFTVMNAQLKRVIPENVTVNANQEITDQTVVTNIRSAVVQDFEGYTDFSLTCSPWTTNDVDGFTTYGIEGYTFLHAGEPMAYIIFNPAATTPPCDQDPDLTPHSGYRYAASFAAISHPNNDWLISPQIALGANGHLKFWVKSYPSIYGLERYKVGVSTTDNNPNSFTIISGTNYLEAATTWTQKDFNLSAYAGMNIYVAIQCVSDDAFIFMVDDIEVTSEIASTSTLTGKVTDAANGEPIPNALVSVAGLDDLTDQNGDYLITDVPAGALNANFTVNTISGDAPFTVQFTDLTTGGIQTVSASATGYTNYSNNAVFIPENENLVLDIAMLLADVKANPLQTNGRNIVSWEWNFGDGDTSAIQNPSHTYASNGSYTVSLKVSDGADTNIETKTAYIQVGPFGTEEAAWEKDVLIYPNPAKGNLFINSDFRIRSIKLVNLNGLEKLSRDNCANNFTLELNDLPGGIYILRVETEKGTLHRKISIAK
jgi:PKD repeat protein